MVIMSETVNADPAELAKFSELAHRWWDTDSEFRPLHQINPLRLDWIDGLASLKGKKVLDVGCGGGILADAMARKGPTDATRVQLATTSAADRSWPSWQRAASDRLTVSVPSAAPPGPAASSGTSSTPPSSCTTGR